MTTLSTAPVRDLLDRLFAEAEVSGRAFREQRVLMQEQGLTHDSPEWRAAVRRTHLAIEPRTGQLLYLLVRSRAPRTVVEFGTSFGVSTLHLAAALRACGSGRLITTEIEPTKVEATRATLTEAGLDDLVELLEGDARQTLVARRPGPIDLLFLDGANGLYVDVLKLLEPDLASGALVVADNANTPGYREYLYGQGKFVSVAWEDRVEVSVLA